MKQLAWMKDLECLEPRALLSGASSWAAIGEQTYGEPPITSVEPSGSAGWMEWMGLSAGMGALFVGALIKVYYKDCFNTGWNCELASLSLRGYNIPATT